MTFITGWHYNGAGAVWRVTAALLGCGLIGCNLAFVRHPPLPPEHSVPWRLFFVGKTLSTLFVVLVLMQHRGSLSWLAPLATGSIAISLFSLGYMWKFRPYKRQPYG